MLNMFIKSVVGANKPERIDYSAAARQGKAKTARSRQKAAAQEKCKKEGGA
jgi:hypothetical protein